MNTLFLLFFNLQKQKNNKAWFFLVVIFFTSFTQAQELETLKVKNSHWTASQTHQQALKLLEKQEVVALGLLEKNFYEHLFWPSYQKLKELHQTPSLWPLASQIGLFAWIALSFFLLFLVWLKKSRGFLIFTCWFLSSTLLFSACFFLFSKRLLALTDQNLYNAPFEKALSIGLLKAGSSVKLLKAQKKWLHIQTTNQQKAWVANKNFLETWQAWKPLKKP